MIHKLLLKNFKRIKDEVFEFGRFDLIVGANNSGKSSALQAMAIWQYCVEQFRSTKRQGARGIQIVLPNFTALPLPEFNLLWTNRTDREYVDEADGSKSQRYVYIEIDLYWFDGERTEHNLCVQLRYQSSQSLYAIPKDGWGDFKQKNSLDSFPSIVYVPPFSGLEPHERWMDDGNLRQLIGKAQPGAVLRNLLYRVIDRNDTPLAKNLDWVEIKNKISDWFGVELKAPEYERGVSTEILAEYKIDKKTYDVIAGGSGFHQIITLLAFVYGYSGAATILLDEPDAHLHVNLQRQIVNYFKQHTSKQFIIATHSEEFIKGVEHQSIISILSGKPERHKPRADVLNALRDIDNIDIVRTQNSPFILYLEGEDDERILSAWSVVLGRIEVFQSFYPYILGGTTKQVMKEKAEKHFRALKHINPALKRVILLDYDNDEVAINPRADQYVLNEWRRKNIDNYLLVPSAWKRAVAAALQIDTSQASSFFQAYVEIIDDFFVNENITLPPNASWRSVGANIFKVVDGKKLLFDGPDSLFNRIYGHGSLRLKINRTAVASSMLADEIHDDVRLFFDNLNKALQDVEGQ